MLRTQDRACIRHSPPRKSRRPAESLKEPEPPSLVHAASQPRASAMTSAHASHAPMRLCPAKTSKKQRKTLIGQASCLLTTLYIFHQQQPNSLSVALQQTLLCWVTQVCAMQVCTILILLLIRDSRLAPLGSLQCRRSHISQIVIRIHSIVRRSLSAIFRRRFHSSNHSCQQLLLFFHRSSAQTHLHMPCIWIPV